jgi:Na+-transporting NADH:ubiquinone oxidoreductase subunit B
MTRALGTPATTRSAPHLRDGLDLRRAMRWVLWAVAPCAIAGLANTGHQALAAAELWLEPPTSGPYRWLVALGLPTAPGNPIACLAYGLCVAAPIAAVAAMTAWAWHRIFVRLRGRGAGEALPVVVALFALSLPPTLPLWQVAFGTSAAVVFGLEIFGGTGRNVANPALVGVALLTFAYPASFSGEGSWIALEGAETTLPLRVLAQQGAKTLLDGELDWRATFLGSEPGALGDTSAAACLLGALVLVGAGLASWRVITGGVLGLVAAVALGNAVGDAARPEVGLPGWWHLTTGSFAFGLVFLATDPVTSPLTNAGRWVYGALIGLVTALVRIFNPAIDDGATLSILLGNLLAPLIDRGVVGIHAWRRTRRGR